VQELVFSFLQPYGNDPMLAQTLPLQDSGNPYSQSLLWCPMPSKEAHFGIGLCYQTVGSQVERVAVRPVQRIAVNVVVVAAAWIGVLCATLVD
jgi:hypothetical protein